MSDTDTVAGDRSSAGSSGARDVGDADFDAEVIERSHEVPVLVDFWAPWCGPCRMLGPVLEEVVGKLEGRVELVKVNTDESPALGMRYQVRSIPAVKLFAGGRVVGEFVGAQSGGSVLRFLESHLPDGTEGRVAAAVAKLGEDPAAARAELESVIADAPDHPAARLALARLALAEGDADAVERHVAEISRMADEADTAERLGEAADLVRTCAAAGGEAVARTRLDAAPDDLDARFALGCCLVQQARWEQALAAFLEIVMKKPTWRERAAARAMVTVFGLMPHDDVRDDYQRKLQIYT